MVEPYSPQNFRNPCSQVFLWHLNHLPDYYPAPSSFNTDFHEMFSP
jgi:hypothetical protein